jgi:DNA (cytosine-5)-methyltransferase 1
MTLMTIPNSFQWTDHDSQLTVENSDEYLRDNEGNIRRCIGEAVPTQIGKDIAGKIKQMLDYEDYVKSGGEDILIIST